MDGLISLGADFLSGLVDIFEAAFGGLNLFPDVSWASSILYVSKAFMQFSELIPPLNTTLAIVPIWMGLEIALLTFWGTNWLYEKIPFI